jgi:hypothetical protein
VDSVLLFTVLDLLETCDVVNCTKRFEANEKARVTYLTQRFTASPGHPKMPRALLTEVLVDGSHL